MTQKIEIRGLRIFGHHGVMEHERKNGQYFVVDAKIWIDSERAAATDDISNTVSYAEIAQLISKNVGKNPVNLLETLSQRLADEVLFAASPWATKVKITVSKPDAPIDLFFDTVAVTASAKKPN
jgi:7,8-dihydroneopterin aldolase/epimerase/oxygenase